MPPSTAKIFKTPKIAIQMVLTANRTFQLLNADFITVAGLWGKQFVTFFTSTVIFYTNGIIYVVVEFRVLENK